ncbi:alpha/beta-hydrolase [Piedraia hortae CBS 480.64]|uniref:triacylglycerol lipase n=1 Tax=Piedraia hortae CBS 480.64 TaxID=1314780 RepID=A0A6A7BXZ8_9PEZI|nr:alpha/beta-hydrolase [Piedraia hortae CBS 480.64]
MKTLPLAIALLVRCSCAALFGDVPSAADAKEFTLRHIYHHGSHIYPNLHRYIDVGPEVKLYAKSTPLTIQRLSRRGADDIDRLLAGHDHELATWSFDDISAPNHTDRGTVLTMARMASNAYVQDHLSSDWKDVKGGFNYTSDFGWASDGLRGHIFADQKNKTLVIGLKGTSPAVFDGADTTGNDKLNDNLFGSCCCGQGGQYLWKTVCDCMTSAYTCNNTCLTQSLRDKSHYYRAVRELYHNVTERYPEVDDVWLSGHSLGGVVAALLGQTYGLPTFTFEAFPDAMAAKRLGLPTPPGYKIGSVSREATKGIFHYGHTADPIYMGTCNSATSFCTIAGYAFQGTCHTGQTCTYDTVGDLGWRVAIGTHKIDNVIRDVLEVYETVPQCETDTECVDCFNWKFYESNGTEPITSSSSSSTMRTSTRTRTETCKTPGWWGCLDESTTGTTSTTTESSSSTKCHTPGWFGCKDPTTTTTTTTTTSTVTSTATSTTCKTPGWFGCRDSTTTVASTEASPGSAKGVATATTTAACLNSSYEEWKGDL